MSEYFTIGFGVVGFAENIANQPSLAEVCTELGKRISGENEVSKLILL